MRTQSENDERSMSRWRRGVVLMIALAALLAGCQSGTTAREPTPFERDVDRLCHAESRSGALEQPEGQRDITVAQWLGSQLETDQARQLLVRLVRAAPPEKVVIIQETARAAGVGDCPLARAWGGR